MDELVIGVDLGGTHMRVAVIDRQGVIIKRHKDLTLIREGVSHTKERLVQLCRNAIAEAANQGGRTVAIGLGVAGKIDPLQGRVIFSPNLPAMNNYPLGSELERSLHLPVVLENDANMFGLGEQWVGTVRGMANCIGLTVGTGVGGCLILQGALWQGDHLGFVGEIGHMIIHPDGPVCACGARGCLEAYASGRALLEGVEAAATARQLTTGTLYEFWKEGKLSPEKVYFCAREGDSTARQLFERMGWALGLTLANLFSVLGMHQAVIGGGVSAGWDQIIGPLRKSFSKYCSMLEVQNASIQRSQLGDDAALLGAARVAWQHKC